MCVGECVCVWVCVWVYVCMHACVCACMCVRACVCEGDFRQYVSIATSHVYCQADYLQFVRMLVIG